MKKYIPSNGWILLSICIHHVQHIAVQGEPSVSQTNSPAVITGLPVVQAPIQSSMPTVLLPPSYSEQKLCRNVKALPISPSFIAPNQKNHWVISKVTKGTQQPPTDSDMNTCSSVNYLPSHCRGLNFIMNTNDGKISTVETYGYNTRTKNLVHFVNEITLADENYLIYQPSKMIKMEHISSRGNVQVPATIPDTVRTSQGTPFAVIAMEPNLKYAVFQSCDQKAAWVAFSEELVNTHPNAVALDSYRKEIEATLLAHGIDALTMTEIDFSLYELNNMMLARTSTSSGPLVRFDITDMEKEFIKLICKMIT